jgi:hypothetical protein
MQWQKAHSAAIGLHHRTLGNRALAVGILRTLAMNIGLHKGQYRGWLGFVENSDAIDRLQRREKLCPVVLVNHRPRRTLDGPNTGVTVDPDNQDVTESFCVTETPNMSDVKQIKAAVRPDNALALVRPFGSEFQEIFERLQLRTRRHEYAARSRYLDRV